MLIARTLAVSGACAMALFAAVAAMPPSGMAQSEEYPSPSPAAASPHAHRHHHSSTSDTSHGSQKRYPTESAARADCSSGTVEWMNTRSGALHPPTDPYYGKTKQGAYVCTTSGSSKATGSFTGHE